MNFRGSIVLGSQRNPSEFHWKPQNRLSNWDMTISYSLKVSNFCSSRQLNGIWEGWSNHLISHTMSCLIWRHEITKKFDITDSVCNLQTKNWENLIFRYPASSDQNFAKFCKVIHLDVRKQSWKFQIDISKIDYFTGRPLK